VACVRRRRPGRGDLDELARGYLDLYCRTLAKVEAIDRYVEER
jgi:hypothetical protein